MCLTSTGKKLMSSVRNNFIIIVINHRPLRNPFSPADFITQNLQSISYGCEIGTSQTFSTFGNVWNNTLTSQHGGLEMSSRGFELAWKSVVFRVFQQFLLALYKYNNEREMVEDLRIRWRTILLVILIDESSSLWNISREKLFEVLK